MTKLAINGTECEADSHPSNCGAVVQGSCQDSNSFTINGTPVATHGGSMHFDSHAHAYNETDGCHDYQSHDLVPDESPSFTHNGNPVMRVGDSTTDPGSGGTADISGSPSHEVTHNV